MDRLYIAVKAPRPGFVKTRLARCLGEETAVALYIGFLRDLHERFVSAAISPTWFVTPDGSWPEIAAATGIGGEPSVVDQGDGDWGWRQDRLFASTSRQPDERVVLIGSDSPQLSAGYVRSAFDLLAESDLVLGPVHDGGYCLVGMRGSHRGLLEVPMSTPSVLDALLRRARSRGLSAALLPPTYDVDEVADLRALRADCRDRSDLPATARALALVHA